MTFYLRSTWDGRYYAVLDGQCPECYRAQAGDNACVMCRQQEKAVERAQEKRLDRLREMCDQ